MGGRVVCHRVWLDAFHLHRATRNSRAKLSVSKRPRFEQLLPALAARRCGRLRSAAHCRSLLLHRTTLKDPRQKHLPCWASHTASVEAFSPARHTASGQRLRRSPRMMLYFLKSRYRSGMKFAKLLPSMLQPVRQTRSKMQAERAALKPTRSGETLRICLRVPMLTLGERLRAKAESQQRALNEPARTSQPPDVPAALLRFAPKPKRFLPRARRCRAPRPRRQAGAAAFRLKDATTTTAELP